jgi:hypothetical protein
VEERRRCRYNGFKVVARPRPCLAVVEEADTKVMVVEADAVTTPWRRSWRHHRGARGGGSRCCHRIMEEADAELARESTSSPHSSWKPTSLPRRGGGHSGKHMVIVTEMEACIEGKKRGVSPWR